MRKQVTFVESLEKHKGVKSEQGVTRSAEVGNSVSNGYKYGACQHARERGTHLSVSAGSSVRPFHFPKFMTTAPFLQHPSLTVGQRRYLYSIANIYSTEQMRRQMKQHYLNVVHSCLQSGQVAVNRRRCTDLQFKQTQKIRQDPEKETAAKSKSQGRRKSSSITNPNIRLPKIVNR